MCRDGNFEDVLRRSVEASISNYEWITNVNILTHLPPVSWIKFTCQNKKIINEHYRILPSEQAARTLMLSSSCRWNARRAIILRSQTPRGSLLFRSRGQETRGLVSRRRVSRHTHPTRPGWSVSSRRQMTSIPRPPPDRRYRVSGRCRAAWWHRAMQRMFEMCPEWKRGVKLRGEMMQSNVEAKLCKTLSMMHLKLLSLSHKVIPRRCRWVD